MICPCSTAAYHANAASLQPTQQLSDISAGQVYTADDISLTDCASAPPSECFLNGADFIAVSAKTISVIENGASY